jgi:hypothetical protein
MRKRTAALTRKIGRRSHGLWRGTVVTMRAWRMEKGAQGTIPALSPANSIRAYIMNRLFAALGAGWGAKKLGGGCFTTVLIFLLLYWLLRNI